MEVWVAFFVEVFELRLHQRVELGQRVPGDRRISVVFSMIRHIPHQEQDQRVGQCCASGFGDAFAVRQSVVFGDEKER